MMFGLFATRSITMFVSNMNALAHTLSAARPASTHSLRKVLPVIDITNPCPQGFPAERRKVSTFLHACRGMSSCCLPHHGDGAFKMQSSLSDGPLFLTG